MRESKFRRLGPPRLEPLEGRSLLSVTPLIEPEGFPAGEAEILILLDDAPLACEMEPLDLEAGFGLGTVMVVGDDGTVSCWPVDFCQTEPPGGYDDWCGTTTTGEVGGPSLDGVTVEVDWMEPDPGYDVIGLPEGPAGEEVRPGDFNAAMPVFDGGDAPLVDEEDLIFYTADLGGPGEPLLVTGSPAALDPSPLAVFLIGPEAAPTFAEPAAAPDESEVPPPPAFEQPTDAGPRDGQDDHAAETARDNTPEPSGLGDELPATLGLAV